MNLSDISKKQDKPIKELKETLNVHHAKKLTDEELKLFNIDVPTTVESKVKQTDVQILVFGNK